MADPLKATFFAFRKREQSGVLLRLAITFVVASIALWCAFIAVFWGGMQPVAEWYMTIIEASINNDTAAIQNAGLPPEFFGLVGGLLLWLFPFYLLCAAFEAGCLRWMIHGENKGLMGLSLAGPTWRVWGCYWIWLLLNLAFALVMGFVSTALLGVMTVSSGGDASATDSVQPVMEVIQLALQIYFGVRLAPAAAVSIARRKFAFFDAWSATKGRFLSLFGSFATIFVLYAIIAIGLSVAAFVVIIGPAAPDFAGAAGDAARMREVIIEIARAYVNAVFNPANWITLGALQLVSVLVGMFFYIAQFGINARAAQAAVEEGKIKAPA